MTDSPGRFNCKNFKSIFLEGMPFAAVINVEGGWILLINECEYDYN